MNLIIKIGRFVYWHSKLTWLLHRRTLLKIWNWWVHAIPGQCACGVNIHWGSKPGRIIQTWTVHQITVGELFQGGYGPWATFWAEATTHFAPIVAKFTEISVLTRHLKAFLWNGKCRCKNASRSTLAISAMAAKAKNWICSKCVAKWAAKTTSCTLSLHWEPPITIRLKLHPNAGSS